MSIGNRQCQSTIVNVNRQSSMPIGNRQSAIRESAVCNRQSPIQHNWKIMDPDYKKMMTWVLIVLAGSVLAAVVIVEWVFRYFGEG
jgi:hypothetical protein